MTDEFREQTKPPDVQLNSSIDGALRPVTGAQGSHEPRHGETPLEATGPAHPFGERSAKRKRRGNPGRPPMSITVVAIARDAYPAYRSEATHVFARMDAAERLLAIDRFCGRLWGEVIRRKPAARTAA